MSFDFANLLDRLDLAPAGPDTYEAHSYDLSYRRVFGGQVIAQGIRALHESGGGKQVRSFTQHFPREGCPETPVTYAVTTVHAGRTFATCTVAAAQGERTIGLMSASLHTPEDTPQDGPAHTTPAPVVTPPEEAAVITHGMIPWELRLAEGGDLEDPAERPARYRLWMRAPEIADHPAATEQWFHQALLAHASEPTLIGTALMPLPGLSQADAGTRFTSAVTSHGICFHKDLRLDDWLLLDQHAPILGGGRAFGRIDVRTREGDLVATVAQESMIRFS